MGEDRCDGIAARPEDRYGNDMQIVHETCVWNKRITEDRPRPPVYMLGIIFVDVPMSGTFPTPAPALQPPFANLVPRSLV